MGLLQMSMQGAVLIAVTAIVRALAGKRLPRRTFLALWAVALARLLIPFSVPSVCSVYTVMEQNQALRESAAAMTLRVQSVPQTASVYPFHSFPWRGLWAVGAAVMAAYFVLGYLHFWREFRFSLPVEEEFPLLWLREHPLRRRVQLRQCSTISAPLTYGIFRPVILLPRKTNWSDTEQVRYILMHEMTHIRHFDTAWKMLAAAALCLHWFNPLVWVMCTLFGRDIELACDASVVRQLGEPMKSSYAMALIQLEEQKSGLPPFCTGFSRTAIEERIRSIMSFRKTSLAALAAAAVLVSGITVVFATSADGTKMSPEDAAMVRKFQFPGYQNMTVAEFRQRAWVLLDEPEMQEWWREMEQNTEYWELANSDPLYEFLYRIVDDLTAENSARAAMYSGAVVRDSPRYSDQAMVEYIYMIDILDRERLTVGEYADVAYKAADDLYNQLNRLLQEAEPDKLHDMNAMYSSLEEEIDAFCAKWSTDSLKIRMEEWYYQPLGEPLGVEGKQTETDLSEYGEIDLTSAETEPAEEPQYPPATKDDYESLLALRVPGYQDMTLEAFNKTVLEWADADYDRMERVYGSALREDGMKGYSEEEAAFLTLTARLSGNENGMLVRSIYTGQPEEDPSFSIGTSYYKGESRGGRQAWCEFWYRFSYHIADRSQVTVGERDRCIDGFLQDVDAFWQGTGFEEQLKMDEQQVVSLLQQYAAGNSTQSITIYLDADDVAYGTMDERGLD